MFDQSPYSCRFDWGPYVAQAAASRGDILIIVDVLRFSSTTVTAAAYGVLLFPHPNDEQAYTFAEQVGADVAGSLSPLSYSAADRGKHYVLRSPNGAACARLARHAPAVFAGCLLNATAVAREVQRLSHRNHANITVVACGEAWPDGSLRPCVEDYLGAGAILDQLNARQSPEAQVCCGAFRSARHSLAELLWECGSGRELRERGKAADVQHCARLDAYTNVPRLIGEHFEHVETADV